MKFIKVLFGIVIFLGIIVVAAFYFGPKLVADEVMEKVSIELQDSGQLETIKEEIENDPELQEFIAEGKDVDSSKLPYQTKEEATRALITKFGIGEIREIQSKAQNGMTAEEKQEIFNKLESNLTEEEMLALKVLAYKELSK
ncbi:hypothetical protein KD050_20185 [Psychrobacillus sp. INOP01]|uniref:hypothetical protein n=1 Tax=Psychrobacillus sp. INOP01 TaxID=2829187 RepID=UPI001BA509BA|nr:hypothetical protein [Psychrobacillus sp. INOP01]QUG41560.1 hypothetical protein KD050_20185 [Psychrobacillus sp. INOP01]